MINIKCKKTTFITTSSTVTINLITIIEITQKTQILEFWKDSGKKTLYVFLLKFHRFNIKKDQSSSFYYFFQNY